MLSVWWISRSFEKVSGKTFVKRLRMKINGLIHQFTFGMLIVAIWLLSSCTNLYEDLPECRLFVKFKYDYNMLYADAFHTQVDKVELYVFDKDGKYLFKQSEEGAALVTGSYLMEVELPVGEYQFMAWAGAHDSYDITSMTPGSSTITDMKLQLIREESFLSSNMSWNHAGDGVQTTRSRLVGGSILTDAVSSALMPDGAAIDTLPFSVAPAWRYPSKARMVARHGA